jgi:hypothetical protein
MEEAIRRTACWPSPSAAVARTSISSTRRLSSRVAYLEMSAGMISS